MAKSGDQTIRLVVLTIILVVERRLHRPLPVTAADTPAFADAS
jgi:hypothetical protein